MLSSKLWTLVLSCALALVVQDALANRLGGVEPAGNLFANVSQHSDSARVMAQADPMSSLAVTTSVPPAPKRLWSTVIGGATTALGLAWLASTFGFGEPFAQMLLVGLVVAAVLVMVGLLRRRRGAAPSGLVYQAAGSGDAAGHAGSQPDPVTPRSYSPKNVGNDSSARPWEQHPVVSEPAAGLGDGALPGWGVPDDFDAASFLKASKANFISLQAAWDRSDIPALRAMMTDDMIEQIKVQLAEREQTHGEKPNQTDVVMLEARLLDIEEVGAGYMASVEFSGLIREDASAGPNPFREVWSITRTKAGPGGWLVAGVQALQ